MPRVSVIMGVYNGAKTLTAAVASIRSQTYSDWEFIICDDGSKDGTWEILSGLAQADGRIVPIRHDNNRGLASSLNTCIDLAKGEYLARQDADDMSVATRFAEQVSYLDEHQDVAVLGTFANLVDDQEVTWGILKHPQFPGKSDWIKGSKLVHPSVLMRREIIVGLGGYAEEAIRFEDYELWLRLVGRGCRIVTMQKALYCLHWNRNDYRRRKFKYRLKEAALKLRHLRDLGLSSLYYIYVLKPILVGMIPPQLLYRYHSRAFGKATATPSLP